MVLILVTDTRRPNRVITTVMEYLEAEGEEFLLTSLPYISLSYEHTGRTIIHHLTRGEIDPSIIFYWLNHTTSALEAMELAGYRLINPISAWRVGRDKALQLALFEKNGIPHPWTFFTFAGLRAVEPRLKWGERDYVFKPHNAGRGRDVHRTESRQVAASLLSRIPRYRLGLLVQEYLSHEPKPRHHYRINVVGGQPVTGCKLEAQGHNWVTNQARGGEVYMRDLSEFPAEVVELAIRAATVVGADYSGVDVIEGPDGSFHVLEANELPGFGESTALYLARHVLEVARNR